MAPTPRQRERQAFEHKRAQGEEQEQAKQVAISEELKQFERMKAERERLQQTQEMVTRLAEVQRTQSAQQLALAKQPEPTQQPHLEADIKQAAKVQSQKDTTAPPYKIAIFPMGYANLPTLDERQSNKSITRYIRENDLLTLTYSYNSDPRDTVRRAEVWGQRNPNLEGVITHAKRLGVHGVVLGLLAGDSYPKAEDLCHRC